MVLPKTIVRYILPLFFLSTLTFLTAYAPTNPTYAQSNCPTTTNPSKPVRVGDGLISANSIDPNFINSSGSCVTGTEAEIPLDQSKIKVDTYDDLYALFFTKNKAIPQSDKVTLAGLLPATIDGKKLYFKDGDLTIAGNVDRTNGDDIAMVFVRGNLYINSNITYAQTDTTSGLIFVVRGDILIDQNVTAVNSILIADGNICTAAIAGTPPFCPTDSILASQLVLNGSLVSLNQSKPILFRRNLADNVNPAEVINTQPKYLVILKDMFSRTLDIVYEDTDFARAIGAAPPFSYGGTTYSVSGKVFIDTNSSGALDASETGIVNQTVLLKTGGGAILSTKQTDSAGNYTFNSFTSSAGTYVVEYQLPTGAIATTPVSLTVTVNLSNPTHTKNFGIEAPNVTVTPSSVSAGGTITVNWSNIYSATTTDYLALAQSTSASSSTIAGVWFYTSSISSPCNQTPGSSARVSGTCTFSLTDPSITDGVYVMKLFRNNGSTLVATSNTFIIGNLTQVFFDPLIYIFDKIDI